MTDPPGDCADGDGDGGASAQYTDLRGKVDDECKTKLRSCKGLTGSTDAAEVDKRWQQNFTCYEPRLDVMQTCFRGGDNRHHRALREVENAMTNCQQAACR